MRLPITPEMKEIREKIEPYWVMNGLEINVADDAPEEIKELDKHYIELLKKQSEEAMKVM